MKKKNVIIATIVAIFVVLLIAVTCSFMFGGKDKGKDEVSNMPEKSESKDLPILIDEELVLMDEVDLEPGTFSKIDKAFNDDEITLDEMYVFKLLAMYGPEELPEKYSSANIESLRGDRIIMMIQEDWEKLSSETQIDLQSFILPFSDEQSFFYHSNYELREEIISNLSLRNFDIP